MNNQGLRLDFESLKREIHDQVAKLIEQIERFDEFATAIAGREKIEHHYPTLKAAVLHFMKTGSGFGTAEEIASAIGIDAQDTSRLLSEMFLIDRTIDVIGGPDAYLDPTRSTVWILFQHQTDAKQRNP